MSIAGQIYNGCAPAERNVYPYQLECEKRSFYRYWICRRFVNPCHLCHQFN